MIFLADHPDGAGIHPVIGLASFLPGLCEASPENFGPTACRCWVRFSEK